MDGTYRAYAMPKGTSPQELEIFVQGMEKINRNTSYQDEFKLTQNQISFIRYGYNMDEFMNTYIQQVKDTLFPTPTTYTFGSSVASIKMVAMAVTIIFEFLLLFFSVVIVLKT